MKTKIILIDEEKIEEELIKEAGLALHNNKLVAFPTETVYGLGANALDELAVKNIYLAKGRPSDNPLIVHISERSQLDMVVKNVPKVALKIMDEFWPGPITIIFEKMPCIPNATSGGLNTVGIRMPSNNIARALIKSAGIPIAAPSANLSGKPSPTNVKRVIEDLDGRVEYIIGGSDSEIGLESTVLDCTVYPPCILRPGAITLEDLKEVDENIYMDKALEEDLNMTDKPKAPGMKYKHYSPNANVRILRGEKDKIILEINKLIEKYNLEDKKVGVISTDENRELIKNSEFVSLGNKNELYNLGRSVFESLRHLDDLGVDVILVEGLPEEGFGIAIMNRLKKAAGFDIIDL